MEYVDSENGNLIAMEKNGVNNGLNGSDNFENGYDGKKWIFCQIHGMKFLSL